jgi:phospholipid:diacylglycerol acyltransferase
MKIFCFYGMGSLTERSYYYAVADEDLEENCDENTGCTHEDSMEHQTACADTETNTHKVPEMV